MNINNVPGIAISRVDVVTGGASAAYGSDAVAGVGIKTDFQIGTSQQGDAKRYRAAFLAGTSFGDERGHMTFSAEWNRSEPAYQGDRDGAARATSAMPTRRTRGRRTAFPPRSRGPTDDWLTPNKRWL